jgi:hypothetical protein
VIRVTTVLAVAAVAAALLTAPSIAAQPSSRASGRYLVVARSAADLSGLRAKAVREGAKVLHTMPQVRALAVQGSDSVRRSLAADGRTLGVARDRVQKITAAERFRPNLSAPGLRGAQRVTAAATHGIFSGPAIDRLKNAPLAEVVVTNTVPVPDEKRIDKIVVLSIAPIVADAIREFIREGV